jgi:hypothetical protein
LDTEIAVKESSETGLVRRAKDGAAAAFGVVVIRGLGHDARVDAIGHDETQVYAQGIALRLDDHAPRILPALGAAEELIEAAGRLSGPLELFDGALKKGIRSL